MLLMIMVILAGMTGWLFYKNQVIWGSFCVILLLVGQGLILADATQHYGTRVVKTTTVSRLRPVGSIHGNQILLTKAIKEGKTTYTAYVAKQINDKSVVILNKHKRVNVNFNANRQAVRSTQNQQYRYTTMGMHWFFSGITNQNQLKRQTVTFKLTSHWHVMRQIAIKRVERKLQRKAVQRQLQVQVAHEVMTQLKRHPQWASRKRQLQAQYLRDAVGRILDQEK